MQAAMNVNFATLKQHVKSIDQDYDAVTVAWNDGSRSVENGMLSCWGGNITDVRLVAKDGGVLPFVRPDNRDEVLGVTTADKVMLVERDGTQVTAQQVLATLEDRAKYMGYTSVKTNLKQPERVVVRVQNIWIPLNKGQAERKFVPAHYSYQTHDKANPRNMILLGTPSGTYVHADAKGINKLYSHTEDEEGVNNHWFTAEASALDVGQNLAEYRYRCIPESKKGRFVEMGLKGMGARTNCFVVISIPNTQLPFALPMHGPQDEPIIYRSLCARSMEDNDGWSAAAIVSADTTNVVSKAAKNVIDIVRPEKEPIVITIMVYNTITTFDDQELVSDEIKISKADVEFAIKDTKNIYALCDATCKLSELPVMLAKYTAEVKDTIAHKLMHDPVPMLVDSDPFKPSASALASVN